MWAVCGLIAAFFALGVWELLGFRALSAALRQAARRGVLVKGGVHLETPAKLKAIAITSKDRSPLLPNFQTIGETLQGYESDTWIGTFVPTGTPQPIIAKLHAATAAALTDPDVKARLDTQGVSIVAGSPAELDRRVSREIKLFTQVVKEQGIKAE